MTANAKLAGSFAASRPTSSSWPDLCSLPFPRPQKPPVSYIREYTAWLQFSCPVPPLVAVALIPAGQGTGLGSELDTLQVAEHRGGFLLPLASLFSVSLWSEREARGGAVPQNNGILEFGAGRTHTCLVFILLMGKQAQRGEGQPVRPRAGLEPRPADLDQGWCSAPSYLKQGDHVSLPVRHRPAEMYPMGLAP